MALMEGFLGSETSAEREKERTKAREEVEVEAVGARSAARRMLRNRVVELDIMGAAIGDTVQCWTA